ncbi:MAG: diaminopimelate epimerase [Flavobacteriales bacterium]|jgi:diaminopimelate epimerase|nr:diaminopimelate epimerase [Flavobacteriales bacterium]
MRIAFEKWHGTGNDFILVDDRSGSFPANDLNLVRLLCDRHFGIGSDGLILIQAPREAGIAFHMEFFNPDASKSFCGNGSRCAFAAWSRWNGEAPSARFMAIDGLHEGEWRGGLVAVSLRDVELVLSGADHDFIHTGSPHEVVRVPELDAVEIMVDGPLRAHHERRGPGGSNVNYVRVADGAISMRTFERGVEAETLSCGTGVVAAAISALARREAVSPVAVRTRGGDLRVEAEAVNGGWSRIALIGPAVRVFEGSIEM